jgi:dihydroorotate dehydrogenase (fumarate)
MSSSSTSRNDADSSMDHIDLSVTIAGLSFPTCLYNASGPRCGTAEAMAKIAASPATGAVVTKSATLVAQDGNPMPRIHHQGDMQASFNSEGLPNKGIDYYIAEETIRTVMVDCCTASNNSNNNAGDQHHKPYIVSLSGKTIADNLEMLRHIFHALRTNPEIHIAAVELNLACPNIIGKPIIAYDVDQVRDCLTQIKNLYDKEEKEQRRTKQPTPPPNTTIPLLPPLGVKLAPYLDLVLLQKVADVIAQHRSLVRYVVTINTVGNTLPVDGTSPAESPYIRPNDGLAGMSGPAITPIALANVWKWRQVLPADIAVIGVGGIRTGQDVYNMLLAGASACQVGTTHWVEGPTCFDRILSELRDILRNKGIRSVSAVTGSLKPWSAANRPKPTPTAASAAVVAKTFAKAKLSSENRLYQGISIVLAVLVAILVADKYNWYHQVG